MTFHFTYEDQYKRVIPAVLIDARAAIPEIAGQIGSVIKNYFDSIVSKVTENTIPYRIESDGGNLAGYFVISVNRVNQSGTLLMMQLRPAFQPFLTDITQKVDTFIMNGLWKSEILF